MNLANATPGRGGLLSFMLAGACLGLLSRGARGQPVTPALESVAERQDVTAFLPLLRSGDLTLVESRPDGRLKQVTVLGLVSAPPQRVWDALTDYAHYRDFMPSLAGFEIVRCEGDEVVAAYEVEVPGSNLEYRLRHRHRPPARVDISLADADGDIRTGAWRWDLVACPGGQQTIVLYTLYTDVRESSWIVRRVLKSQPAMEHAMNVATGLLTVSAVRRWAEKPR
ncbi:MAG: hypothetical protein GYA21_16700 [Myxococcales bacterium]|nr:hypothetical protein [Myxococcales bacterium]